ncbi:hypothetical protein ACFSSA_06120 [Luteolibacter algae]|uniref:DUF2207 domain-containing protein n=1 Tax=Luteolibacter algae TaxID=454151 RepID=A0ABW5D6A1_9BACT
MPAFFEFLLVALALYIWESTLWLPKQGVALRRSWLGKKWRVIQASALLSMRDLGLVPMSPVPPDIGLAPCASFPLAVAENGEIHVSSSDGIFTHSTARAWEDIRFSKPYLHVGQHRIRCQSPAVAQLLRDGKLQGLTPAEAIRRAWKLTLSPSRAKWELRKWSLVSSSLRLYPPALTFGFFLALPFVYFTFGSVATFWFSIWLWCLMLGCAGNLFWLAKRAYPGARGELRQDALLSLLIPFHAMRSLELASVHAFGTTHPTAVLIQANQANHPWLARFYREKIFPRPTHPGDAVIARNILPLLENHLSKYGFESSSFLSAPDRSEDREASAWCPRCHGMFLQGKKTCVDCGNLRLNPFDK